MKYKVRVAAALALTALVAVGCSSTTKANAPTTTAKAGDTTTTAKAGDATTTASAGGAATADGQIKCTQQYAGKTIEIMSPGRGDDVKPTIAAFVPFEKCTGAKINWNGTDQFESDIKVRIDGGNYPDLIDFPQPGLMKSLAAKGKLKELPADLGKKLTTDYAAGWDVLGSLDGKAYAIPESANVKSLVWYSPADFKAKGYTIPTTIDELKALSDKIVADGAIPWCAGIESGTATGWAVTDWFEDFMLRVNGGDVYDQWVSHKIPFNDPKVVAVADQVASFLKNPKYFGGDDAVKAIATTSFKEGGLPILSKKCFMHRQASFYSSMFPKGTTFGEAGQVSFFYLPTLKAGDKKVMLVAGDVYSLGHPDKPEAVDALRYMASSDFDNARLAAGDHGLSPLKNFDLANYSDPLVKSFGELLKSAEVVRFDGSDLMPGAVGTGTFWKEATAWVIGGSTSDMLGNIEKTWPKA